MELNTVETYIMSRILTGRIETEITHHMATLSAQFGQGLGEISISL